MYTLLLAAGIAAGLVASPPKPVGVFTAVLKPGQPAPESLNGITGTASVSVDENGISYSIQMAGVARVTNVILLSGVTAVPLHTGSPTTTDAFDVSGEVAATAVPGVSIAQLTQRLLKGTAEIVIFTESMPDGRIRGRLSGAIVDVPDPEQPSVPPITAVRP